ncbi:unnamed protein product [Lactuca saligna]|uniref:Uncharacterized protein n=1 Tax=Lactuca saligna TaxID=75948 RepID=A0AA36DWH5_LACSI|nr:unnamed protein product [Lactuca saligna]
MIQDETSPKPVSPSPQVEIVPPLLTPIKTVAFHQDDQEESNSNFQIVVLSQVSVIVKITQSLEKRLTKAKKDVADMKRLIALVDIDVDDMVADDTPSNSPGDNPLTPPPPSINLPPPSHPPPHIPSPPPNSLP